MSSVVPEVTAGLPRSRGRAAASLSRGDAGCAAAPPTTTRAVPQPEPQFSNKTSQEPRGRKAAGRLPSLPLRTRRQRVPRHPRIYVPARRSIRRPHPRLCSPQGPRALRVVGDPRRAQALGSPLGSRPFPPAYLCCGPQRQQPNSWRRLVPRSPGSLSSQPAPVPLGAPSGAGGGKAPPLPRIGGPTSQSKVAIGHLTTLEGVIIILAPPSSPTPRGSSVSKGLSLAFPTPRHQEPVVAVGHLVSIPFPVP
jgi:hypothetical protein